MEVKVVFDKNTIELVECDKCGYRDWKIYANNHMSQDGDGCFNCNEGVLRSYKRFKVNK